MPQSTSNCVGIVEAFSQEECENVEIAREPDTAAENAKWMTGENMRKHVRT
tara:strand:+ start:345 stop:497 length:153 start_codon:yes stop_codon:yes gene_type:complete